MWTKLDDGYTEHPKIAAAGFLAMSMDVAGMVYCGRNLTDGYVPYNIAQGLIHGYVGVLDIDNQPESSEVDVDFAIKRLIDVGRWHTEETIKACPGCMEHWPNWNRGYYIHDYLDYNPTRESVMADRARARSRMAAARSSKVPTNKDGSSAEVRPNMADSGDVQENFAGSSDNPAPAPAPAPEPDPIPEDQVQTLAPQAARNGEGRPKLKTLDDQQLYLMQKLQERSEAWRDLTPGGIVKLNGIHGRPAVLEALRRMHEEIDTEPENGGFPLVAEVARVLNESRAS